ncbi:hypothetical protein PFISCL1PPCAC_12119, partial [Pristionchus fissidentatus]
RMLILSNEKIRNGKKKLMADKYFTLDGKLFIMNVHAFDPRMPIRMYELINGRKVNEVGVHYSIGIPWINMFVSSSAFVYEGAVYIWAFDSPDDYEISDDEEFDYDEIEQRCYLHRGTLESDGFHWTT